MPPLAAAAGHRQLRPSGSLMAAFVLAGSPTRTERERALRQRSGGWGPEPFVDVRRRRRTAIYGARWQVGRHLLGRWRRPHRIPTMVLDPIRRGRSSSQRTRKIAITVADQEGVSRRSGPRTPKAGGWRPGRRDVHGSPTTNPRPIPSESAGRAIPPRPTRLRRVHGRPNRPQHRGCGGQRAADDDSVRAGPSRRSHPLLVVLSLCSRRDGRRDASARSRRQRDRDAGQLWHPRRGARLLRRHRGPSPPLLRLATLHAPGPGAALRRHGSPWRDRSDGRDKARRRALVCAGRHPTASPATAAAGRSTTPPALRSYGYDPRTSAASASRSGPSALDAGAESRTNTIAFARTSSGCRSTTRLQRLAPVFHLLQV